MTASVERVTDAAMAAVMGEELHQLDGYLRTAFSDPFEAVAIAALWIAHVHRHASDNRQLLIEDMMQKYLSDMRTRREQWQEQRM